MSRIKINNFGPIKNGLNGNDGWIDIKKVTLFIGNQGSGKSTIAKIISTFSWIEKTLVRGDYPIKWFTTNRLKKLLGYHRLDNYFYEKGNLQSYIEYVGEAYRIKYEKKELSILKVEQEGYELPQIMYVPAERNFISYVKTPKELKLASPSLAEFLVEFNNAKSQLRMSSKMPFSDTEIEYDRLNDVLNLKGKDYKVRISESSSGFQSAVPLHLVSSFLANSIKKQSESRSNSMTVEERERFREEVEKIFNNPSLTVEQKNIALSVLTKKFNNSVFINIVEEPEQNLFPNSQRKMLNELLSLNNLCKGNKLIITTHSPYLINYLSLAVKAKDVFKGISSDDLILKVNALVPLNAFVNSDDLAIYELDDFSGTISTLELFDGLPSDENMLNSKLDESNEIFAQLLEIEQQL